MKQPMETDLLWGYEGLTDYLGPMLAARSGLWTAEQYHEQMATIAASLGPGRPGRTWRPLLDTAVGEPGLGYGRGWFTWRRGTDYYDEGDLLWLEVATIIHRESHGEKSIDDFCQAFHGGANNGPEVKTYTFDQLVSALNAVTPFDWAVLPHQAGFHFSRSARGRHRERRLEGCVQRSAREDARTARRTGRRVFYRPDAGADGTVSELLWAVPHLRRASLQG